MPRAPCAAGPGGQGPRVSVVVSAWDLVDLETFKLGPKAWLGREYPLFAGRLDDIEGLDLRVFGLRVVGGDLKADESCRNDVQENGLDGRGWVAVEDDGGTWRWDPDLTFAQSRGPSAFDRISRRAPGLWVSAGAPAPDGVHASFKCGTVGGQPAVRRCGTLAAAGAV